MKAKAKPSNAQPALVVDSEVVRQIRQHARSSSKTEVCGVLIGQDRDHRIDVAACIEGQNAEEAGAHVTFTQDTWEHIYAVKDQKYPEARIVGWYHSHPGFGVFLSDHDTFIHKNFFSSPGQVAWVFDPHSDEEGCFGWVGGRIERLTQIGVVDRRGGEEAREGGVSEPVTQNANDEEGIPLPREKKKISPIRIRGRDVDEGAESSDSSLERLVFRVFFYLAASALGFALAWYVFPRVVVMPVLLDPRTGQLIDMQTGQVIADSPNVRGSPTSPANPAKPEVNNSGQPSSTNPSGKKGNDAQPK
ncbi:MAG: Mov34/MPN/PAD-1 family protein [Candidatus Sulfotelmatobacter sp.]|jgi:proteasome lid subunit RPN8/RPN11